MTAADPVMPALDKNKRPEKQKIPYENGFFDRLAGKNRKQL